jgi:hypothetical protein
MSAIQTPVGIIGAKEDPRLTFLLEKTVEAVHIFTEAIRNSPDTCECVGFKAFSLKSKEKEEVDNVFDIIMTKVGMELHKHSKDLVDKYTFFHEKKDSEDNEEVFDLFLYCRKEAPPSKENIDKLVKEEEAKEKAEQEAKEAEKANEQEKIEKED